MPEMSKEEFERQKSEAANRMREMYKAQGSFYPSFVALPDASPKPTVPPPKAEAVSRPKSLPNNIFKFLNFSEILKSPDSLLILGLILLLLSDNADEKLILALVFILL